MQKTRQREHRAGPLFLTSSVHSHSPESWAVLAKMQSPRGTHFLLWPSHLIFFDANYSMEPLPVTLDAANLPQWDQLKLEGQNSKYAL